ncbi:MAG: carboxypeptidase-like regulatory domain-containing protein, partial [Acidobacteriota bacterium]
MALRELDFERWRGIICLAELSADFARLTTTFFLYETTLGDSMKAAFLARVFVGMLLMGSISTVFGQGFQGTIRGDVQDQTGALIPLAMVTVTNVATGETRTLLSSDAGTFNFPNLLVSTYTVTVEFSGFKKYSRENVQVSANSVSDVVARLEVGQSVEHVVVTAGQEPVVISTAQLEGFTTR